jgi:alkylglycerol monooxygenase
MELSIEWMIGVMLAIFALLFLSEWLFSFLGRKGYYSGEHTVLNLSLALMQQISGIVYQIIFLGTFVWVQQHASIQHFSAVPAIPVGWPVSMTSSFPYLQIHWIHVYIWVMVLLLADFCQYWLHRFSHEVHLLWAGHIVHHSDTEYNYSVALRQSSIEGLYTWIFYLPLAFMGIPWELFVSAYTCSIIWQFFVHTRAINSLGWIEQVWVGPRHHRVHHARNEKYLDKNYGALLIIWDKLFGSYQDEEEAPEFGITKPLTSANFLWMNVHQYIHLIRMWRVASGLREKCRVVFGRPSFMPESAKETVMDADLKMHFTKQKGKKWYIYFSFLTTAVIALLWSNTLRSNGALAQLVPVIFYTGISLYVLTGLLQDKHMFNVAEVARLALQCGVGLFLLFNVSAPALGWILVITATVLLMYTWYLAENYKALESLKSPI